MRFIHHIQNLSAILLLFSATQAGAQITGGASERIEYGVKASLNYSTIGNSYSKYSGSGQYSLGIFGTYMLSPTLTVAFEPAFSSSGFRETQADRKYTYYHFDGNFNAYIDPFRNEAIRLYFGIRPAYLINYKSEVFTSGVFVKDDVQENKNKQGQFDMGVNGGVSVRLSPVVNFELGYMWSATNNTDNSQINGRPSLIEMTLKINAVDLKNLIDTKETTIKEQVQHYQKGSVLVMLPTLTNKELARFKNESDRNFAVNELRLRNLKVIQEFIRNYTFNSVYFFMDTSVNRIISGNLDGIFVNQNMQPDLSIKPADTGNFFIASFTHDISAYSQKYSYGLFIYDNKMNQLSKPYNIPSQIFGLYTDGDPANYFRTKRQSYVTMPFDRMIRKFNSRMLRIAEFENN